MWLALSGGSRFDSQLPASPDYIGYNKRLYGNSREAADSLKFHSINHNSNPLHDQLRSRQRADFGPPILYDGVHNRVHADTDTNLNVPGPLNMTAGLFLTRCMGQRELDAHLSRAVQDCRQKRAAELRGGTPFHRLQDMRFPPAAYPSGAAFHSLSDVVSLVTSGPKLKGRNSSVVRRSVC